MHVSLRRAPTCVQFSGRRVAEITQNVIGNWGEPGVSLLLHAGLPIRVWYRVKPISGFCLKARTSRAASNGALGTVEPLGLAVGKCHTT